MQSRPALRAVNVSSCFEFNCCSFTFDFVSGQFSSVKFKHFHTHSGLVCL